MSHQYVTMAGVKRRRKPAQDDVYLENFRENVLFEMQVRKIDHNLRLAEMTGINQSVLGRYLDSMSIPVGRAKVIADKLGVPLDYLLRDPSEAPVVTAPAATRRRSAGTVDPLIQTGRTGEGSPSGGPRKRPSDRPTPPG